MKSALAISATGLLLLLAACTKTASGSSAALEPAAPSPASAAPAPATVAPAPALSTQKPPANAMGSATKAFKDRLVAYVNFHNNVEKTVPPLVETSDPAKISAREKALGDALIKARPSAKPGDFFLEEYQPYIIQIIKEDFAKRSLADRKAMMQEPPKGVTVTVNQIYPTVLPLATLPPNLLKALPELPPELEYRFVGRDLILRDVTGNVVVDVMHNALPISA